MVQSSLDHSPLHGVPDNVFLFAPAAGPPVLADVIIVKPIPAGPGYTDHRRAARPTKQLTSKHILPVFTVPPLRILFCFQPFSHLQEKGLVHDGGHTALHPDIRITVNPYIGFIVQQGMETILFPQAAPFGMYTPPV